jgi:hypothetical protein
MANIQARGIKVLGLSPFQPELLDAACAPGRTPVFQASGRGSSSTSRAEKCLLSVRRSSECVSEHARRKILRGFLRRRILAHQDSRMTRVDRQKGLDRHCRRGWPRVAVTLASSIDMDRGGLRMPRALRRADAGPGLRGASAAAGGWRRALSSLFAVCSAWHRTWSERSGRRRALIGRRRLQDKSVGRP